MSVKPVVASRVTKTFNLKKKFVIKALDEVSFELNSGEIVGLIGPNGAGKTTLLRIMMGLLKLDSGEIKLFDSSVFDTEAKMKIGYQPESAYRAKNVKAVDFLKFNSSLAGIDNNDEQIEKYLNYFNLMPSIDKSLSALSSGQRQKLELAQAFLGNPELVILDEPTSALDPPSVFELRDFINEKKNQGQTILFSSHNLSEVVKICDRVMLLFEGQIKEEFSGDAIESESLEEAFRKYQSNKEL